MMHPFYYWLILAVLIDVQIWILTTIEILRFRRECKEHKKEKVKEKEKRGIE